MPSRSYKPSLKTLRNQDVIIEAKTVYTTRGPKQKVSIRSPLSIDTGRKGHSSSIAASSLSQEVGVTFAVDQSGGYNTSDMPDGFTSWGPEQQEPLKIRKTKV
jgi:hypothetical protein